MQLWSGMEVVGDSRVERAVILGTLFIESLFSVIQKRLTLCHVVCIMIKLSKLGQNQTAL